MSAPAYNLLAVRKTIGAIKHRLNEETLPGDIRARIIDRQLADLLDTLPGNFHELLCALVAANLARDYVEFVEGLLLLADLLPPQTYGAIPAGTVFRLANGSALYVKRKEHAEGRLAVFQHFPPGTVVVPVND